MNPDEIGHAEALRRAHRNGGQAIRERLLADASDGSKKLLASLNSRTSPRPAAYPNEISAVVYDQARQAGFRDGLASEALARTQYQRDQLAQRSVEIELEAIGQYESDITTSTQHLLSIGVDPSGFLAAASQLPEYHDEAQFISESLAAQQAEAAIRADQERLAVIEANAHEAAMREAHKFMEIGRVRQDLMPHALEIELTAIEEGLPNPPAQNLYRMAQAKKTAESNASLKQRLMDSTKPALSRNAQLEAYQADPAKELDRLKADVYEPEAAMKARVLADEPTTSELNAVKSHAQQRLADEQRADLKRRNITT